MCSPPIKTALVFNWTWRASKSLDEVEARLRRGSFYVVRPRRDVLVATSSTRPFMVVFVLLEKGIEGGDLIVIESPEGWYSDEEVVEHMPLFDKIAGIESFKAS
ncbi:MAG: hypothetical protein DRJ97_03345 [Thermoprotei archaeon]|nr:MAG: hypothetical protein DRJ97_03345 [Thermoprotei archaeon]